MISILGPETNLVATAKLTSKNVIANPRGLPIPRIDMFYFRSIELTPMVVFRHLAGVALMTWLDGCFLRDDDCPDPEVIGPCRYIHGRSEVMKGKHSISAVLVAAIPLGVVVTQSEWMVAVPELYKQFLEVLDLATAKSE
jgi:hypothetical protein